MADDTLNQPTTKADFDRGTQERAQLEQDIKALLSDLETANPESITALAQRLKALQEKRHKIAAN